MEEYDGAVYLTVNLPLFQTSTNMTVSFNNAMQRIKTSFVYTREKDEYANRMD